MFSILIPTWNNLAYLQLCLRSIEDHSKFQHQVIVIVNEGSDGSTAWLEENNIEYIHFKENVGICTGLNSATDKVKHDYVVYLNDDMYVLPDWDSALSEEINAMGHKNFMLSGTMIEPYETGNKTVIVKHFGDAIDNFKEGEVLTFHKNEANKEDWSGSTWPPVLVPTKLWKQVGGMSEEFSPGFYSDPDLSMKLWQAGVRVFKGIGKSRVYHFGSKSTKKVKQNTGRKIFLNKWNISANYFYKHYLKMGSPWNGPLPNHRVNLANKLIHRLKK